MNQTYSTYVICFYLTNYGILKQSRGHTVKAFLAVINLEIQVWVLKYGFSRFLTDRERFAQQPNFNYVRQIEVFWAMIQYS